MRRRFATLGALLALSAIGAGFAACSSSNNPSAPNASGDSGADTGTSDAGTDSSVLPPYLDAGIFATALAVTVPGAPISMAYDPVNHQLYAGLSAIADAGGVVQQGVGIAVVDGRSKQLTTVIGEPDGGDPELQSIVALAVDATANKIYGTDGANIYVIDGTSQAVTQTIPSPNAVALAVDPATHQLFALQVADVVLDSGFHTTNALGTLVAYDAQGAPTGTTALADLTFPFPPLADSLAFEPSTSHLYVCGNSAVADAAQVAAIDTFDVASNLTEAPQQTFAGQLFGCIAGFGGGALVTDNPSGAINFVDPASVAMPGIFTPSAMTVNVVGSPTSILFGGQDLESNALVMNVASDGTITVQPSTAAGLPQAAVIQTMAAGEAVAGNVEEVFLAIEPGSLGVAVAANQIVYGEVQIR